MRFFVLFFIFNVYNANSQPIVVKTEGKASIPTLKQEQIEAMETIAEGYVVFNLSSGCLNYYFAGRWMEVCGECTPKPKMPKIDSIIQKNNLLNVYFKPFSKGDLSFKIAEKKEWLSSKESPFVLVVPPNTSNLSINIRFSNSCGQTDSSLNIKTKNIEIAPVLMMDIDGKQVPTRKINGLRWMCQDYVHPSIKTTNKEHPSFVAIHTAKNVCPEGWQLPDKKQWESLLVNYTNDHQALFLPATNENTSIHLQSRGFYTVEEKKYYPMEATYYWMRASAETKENVAIVSATGELFVNEKPELLQMPLRCVKYE